MNNDKNNEEDNNNIGHHSQDDQELSDLSANFENIESEEERKPNRVIVKKVSIKMNEIKNPEMEEYEEIDIDDMNSPQPNVAIETRNVAPISPKVYSSPVKPRASEHIEPIPVEAKPCPEPSHLIVRNEESQQMNPSAGEFDNMILDVDKELLVSENEYSGNIDLANKEQTRKVYN
jgi:hypothetical protein